MCTCLNRLVVGFSLSRLSSQSVSLLSSTSLSLFASIPLFRCTTTITTQRIQSSKITTTTTTRTTSTNTTSQQKQQKPQLVIVENRDTVRLIGINRPEKRNCVNRATALQLRDAFDAFERDETARVAVLHGFGGTFCAGYDLSELASFGSGDGNAFKTENADDMIQQQQQDAHEQIHQLIVRGPMGPSQMMLSKPVIAAIDGYAVAGGFELALWCDLRVVEHTAIMGVFCRRFGVPLIDGGTVRLQALIGLSRALDLILTGRPINGKEAAEYGIANRLVPVGTALGQAYKLAESLVKFPQKCLHVDRKSAYNAAFDAATQADALQYEFDHGKQVILEESIKGASNFVHHGIGRHGKFALDKFDYDVDVTV